VLTTETWTTERIEQLKGYVAAGWSYGKISQLLNLSRGSVIAKANRIGIVRGKPLVAKPAKLAEVTEVEPAVVELAPEPIPDGKVGRYALTELTDRQCKFPIGDEVPYRFCGDKTVDGLPYCAPCARRAYVVLPPPLRSLDLLPRLGSCLSSPWGGGAGSGGKPDKAGAVMH
jgi:GcrA cell cycle regulator